MPTFNPDALPPLVRRILFWPGHSHTLLRIPLAVSALLLSLFARHWLRPAYEAVVAFFSISLLGVLTAVMYVLPAMFALRDLAVVCTYVCGVAGWLRGGGEAPRLRLADEGVEGGLVGVGGLVLRLGLLGLACWNPRGVGVVYDAVLELGLRVIGALVRAGVVAVVVRDWLLVVALFLRGAVDEYGSRREAQVEG
ncbi:hypothetical protein SLS58_011232 [Diplodia intermedia]|uniref:Uncharacterized protein n=1 Tax=Diplodia intermedia TaxID=856260 RepID=A0ABR3T0D5_9PEZI